MRRVRSPFESLCRPDANAQTPILPPFITKGVTHVWPNRRENEPVHRSSTGAR